jgi:hypothetical protein
MDRSDHTQELAKRMSITTRWTENHTDERRRRAATIEPALRLKLSFSRCQLRDYTNLGYRIAAENHLSIDPVTASCCP